MKPGSYMYDSSCLHIERHNGPPLGVGSTASIKQIGPVIPQFPLQVAHESAPQIPPPTPLFMRWDGRLTLDIGSLWTWDLLHRGDNNVEIH